MAEDRLTAALREARRQLDIALQADEVRREKTNRVADLVSEIHSNVLEHFGACDRDADRIRRETAAQFYRDVRQLMKGYAGQDVAAMPFGASLDQVAVEVYGLTEKEMGDA